MVATVSYQVDGLREARAAVRKAGGSLDDLEAVNRDAAELIQQEAVKRAPRRTGKLRAHIFVDATPTTGKVIGSATTLPYLGVVHFGWVTRNATKGMSRKEAQSRFEGTLARRTINKSVRGQKARTLRRQGQVVGRKGAVRGGPVPPNPFLWAAVDHRVNEVFKTYEQKADEIAKVLAG